MPFFRACFASSSCVQFENGSPMLSGGSHASATSLSRSVWLILHGRPSRGAPDKISFILTTGMRFIPTMEKKAQQIIDAQRARGAKFHQGGLVKKIKAYIPVMIPMIVESLRMSENLAMAMLNRGFGAKKNWTVIEELNPGMRDLIITMLLLLIITGVFYAKIQGYGKL